MAGTRERGPTGVSRLFGRQVKAVREHLRWSQAQLSDRLKELGVDMHQVTIARIESGERRVTIDDAFALAAALGVSPQLLLSGSYTSEDVPVLPGRDATPNDVRFWLGDDRQLPGLDEDTYFEIVPDADRLARRRQSIEQLRRRFVEFREAWLDEDLVTMKEALLYIQGEINYQQTALDREKRMAEKARPQRAGEED